MPMVLITQISQTNLKTTYKAMVLTLEMSTN